MEEKKASKTAVQMALSRAIESSKPEDERVCYDPFAKHFLNTTYTVFSSNRLLRWVTVHLMEHLFPGHNYYVVVRTRYIDDYLRDCIDQGIKQLIIMGAGYDSRAYRFDGLKKIKVIEVDHPATQAKKKEKIKKIFGSLQVHVVYVAVDFTNEKLSEKLLQNGYDKNLKTLFIWEGTTPYLTAEAIDETLSFVSSNEGKGSSILFDYILKSVVDGTCKLEEAKNEFERMAKTEEPFTFGMKENKVESFLNERGFYNVKDAGSEDFKKAYFKDKHQKRKIKSWWRIVYATIKP